MSLTPGSRLAHYEILAPIGAGGMGEVFRARDTKLGREVAIKILPASLARDPDRLARFEREAKVLASLNHPNIAAIYGLEDTPDGRALVMELVPGETLKRPLALDTALAYFKQIAEALETAHEKGIVHRDLKPGNIMVTPEGVIKVLDFGLAAVGGGSSATTIGADPENSPTMTMAATQAGIILGTAAYMSPEQAAGKTVDRRSDIWSFGVVFWEMLTGARLFGGGETMSHTLADVLRAPVDFDKLPAGTPARVRELLQRCLDRDLKNRLRDIGEARVVLQRAIAEPESRTEVRQQAEARATSRWAWAVAGVLGIVAAAVSFLHFRETPLPEASLTRLSVDLGPEAQRHSRVSVLLSPDGTRIVYAAKASGGLFQLLTRRLDQPNATVLVASPTLDFEPFFSPDSQWVGFWSNTGSQIMKVPAQGGAAVPLGTPAGPVFGASWGDDNNILIGGTDGLWRLPASGGTPQRVANATGVLQLPQVLPGSKAALVNSATVGMNDLDGQDIDVFELGTGKRKTMIRGGYWPRYLPTSGTTGHLLYIHTGSLYGVGFDPGSLELVGTPTVLLDDVAADPALNDGGGQFDFSKTGTFVYLSGKTQGTSYPISWLDAAGKTAPLLSTSGNYGVPRLSPDGKRVAYLAAGGKGSDVWVYDIDRGTPTQLTFTGGLNSELAWARDSRHLVYGDGTGLWWIRADGAGQRQPLLEKAANPRPFSFAPTQNNNEARLAFSPVESGLPYISTLPIDLTDSERPKAGKPETFLAAAALAQVDPVFSQDGKFIAYASSESGDEEVFVRPFPGPGGKWKVSSKGGKFPVWSVTTHELFFLGGDDRIMAASYTTQGDAFSAGVPRVWSPTQVRRVGVRQNFDVSPDGKRVIMFPRPVAEESSGNLHATFLLNFFDEVRRRVPVGEMSMTPGQRIAHYEILAPIGAGGMGEVFRARDTKLGREVAIKILPASLARDPDRLARFEREAKVLASLNHPNIAAIYGLEETADGRALVMELVPGDTLKKLLPVGTALAYFKQIAEALETAHEKGIVHRDLKPGNIMVTPDGVVKVLDFGLAAVPARAEPGSDPDNSPTITMAATQAGLIMGTAAYMSPEQAAGMPVDRRADIWSFGVVLWETLTGERLFSGETMSHTLADVLRAPVDFGKLPAATPVRVRELLQRCLDRDLKNRLQHIGEARVALGRSLTSDSQVAAEPATSRALATAPSLTRLRLVSAVLGLAAGVFAYLLWSRPDGAQKADARLTIALPPGYEITTYPAITEDGRTVAYAARQGSEEPLLYLRDLNSFAARTVAGSNGAKQPFFSPDGKWVAFFAQGLLQKAEVAGGTPIRIADAPNGLGGSWGEDNSILYTPTLGSGILRVAASGGTPETVTKPDGAGKGYTHSFPQWLPGGESALFTVWGQEHGGAVVRLDTKAWKIILPTSSFRSPTYDSVVGRLLMGDDMGGLRAAQFDAAHPASTSADALILPDVYFEVENEAAGWLAVSQAGAAVYVPGNPNKTSLVWVDRRGNQVTAGKEQGLFREVDLSPDGTQAIVRHRVELWIHDLQRSTRTRLTAAGDANMIATWSGDGARVIFSSNRGGNWDLHSQPADGSGPAEVLLKRPADQFPLSVSADGHLLFYDSRPGTGRDLWTLSKDGVATPFRVTPANETEGRFSPDGKSVAYSSDESGRYEVYLQSFPGGAKRTSVSTGGGTQPLWSHDGKELFYLAGDAVMVVAMSADGRAGTPQKLFDRSPYFVKFRSYDVSPDGKRFLMIRQDEGSVPRQLNVILNWAGGK